MNKFVIHGGKILKGEIYISGSKNSALPIMAASLLSTGNITIRNIPKLKDISIMIDLLKQLGVQLIFDEQSTIHINASNINNYTAPYELVKEIRASILILVPLLIRFGKANLYFPGGCAIGNRPINLHIQALQKMGVKINIYNQYIKAYCNKNFLLSNLLVFDKVTVTGTENILMAAVFAKGKTVIKNAACEPEITDLANFLICLGAKIVGAGTETIEIEGVKSLSGGHYTVMPDRIESGTYLAAAALTRGKITIRKTNPKILLSILSKFKEAGANVYIGKDWITLDMQGIRPNAVNIRTAPYPNFPTDMQAQFTALNAIAKGMSSVIETIFENRFMHVKELNRMGAKIFLNKNTAVIQGVKKLNGVSVIATDLRASAGLILAGLAAEGETIIENIYHIDRGYENIEKKLTVLGANIYRI